MPDDLPQHTPPELQAHLRTLEQSHLEPGVRSDPSQLGSLLHASYTEVGASGAVHTRAAVLTALETETSTIRTMRGFTARLIADDAAITNYTVEQPQPGGGIQYTRRASIWVRDNGTWRMVYHQGTPVISTGTRPT